MQTILDRYKVGVEVVGINLQQGGVRPPEQVQAAFDDVLKAGQERERAKNEAQAYANDVVPRAVGSASRLKEEAEAYKARIVAQAQGDAQRFRSVLAEYQKAPQVTRDRMYIDAMQQIYGNVTKVLVDSRQGSNLLYLPLDKMHAADRRQAGAAAERRRAGVPAAPAAPRRLPRGIRPPTPARATTRRTPRPRHPLSEDAQHEQNRIHRHRRCWSLLALLSSMLFVVDQRQFGVVYALGQIKEVITEPGLQLQAAAAVPERVATSTSAC